MRPPSQEEQFSQVGRRKGPDPAQDIPQQCGRIETKAAGCDQKAVDSCIALSGIRVANKKPVFFLWRLGGSQSPPGLFRSRTNRLQGSAPTPPADPVCAGSPVPIGFSATPASLIGQLPAQSNTDAADPTSPTHSFGEALYGPQPRIRFHGQISQYNTEGDQGDDLLGPRSIVTHGFMELTPGMHPTGHSE